MIPLISVIIPAYNEASNIKTLIERLHQTLSNTKYNFELIIINDGSIDNSITVISELALSYPELYFIDFTRNFGHQNALKAGYDHAKGNAVICMDADLQHPPEFVIQMLQKWEDGFEVVLGQRKSSHLQDGFFKKFSSKVFYTLLNFISETPIDPDTPDFRLVDEKLVHVIKNLSEKDLFLRGLIPWMGYNKIILEYDQDKRLSGKSSYNPIKMFMLALSGITGFSVKPLHSAIIMGIIISGLSGLYIPYILVRYFTGHVISGWSSLIIAVTFLGGIQLFILGIIGLYLGKLFIQVKNRPEYIIRKANLDGQKPYPNQPDDNASLKLSYSK